VIRFSIAGIPSIGALRLALGRGVGRKVVDNVTISHLVEDGTGPLRIDG
jgi:hypothetical protein